MLDDAARPGERVVARRWRKARPDFDFRARQERHQGHADRPQARLDASAAASKPRGRRLRPFPRPRPGRRAPPAGLRRQRSIIARDRLLGCRRPASRRCRRAGCAPSRSRPSARACVHRPAAIPDALHPAADDETPRRDSSALRPVQQLVVGQHQRHHRLDHRRAADADAGIVAARSTPSPSRSIVSTGVRIDEVGLNAARTHDRLPGRDAAGDAAGMVGEECGAVRPAASGRHCPRRAAAPRRSRRRSRRP